MQDAIDPREPEYQRRSLIVEAEQGFQRWSNTKVSGCLILGLTSRTFENHDDTETAIHGGTTQVVSR